jgi:hypothetical protein
MDEEGYSLRRATEEDFEGIAQLLSRRDPDIDLPGWLRWKFMECPDGPGQILVAEDPQGQILGMMAYLPRQFTSARTGTFYLMQSVDAFVAKDLRTKGIYSGITALARKEMNVPKIAFPNELSIGFGVKFGWRVLAPLRVWRFPVVLGWFLSRQPFRLLAPIANAASRLYAFCWMGPLPRDLQMKAIDRFERDFTVDPNLIHGVRSAAYLNWRFIDNPTRTCPAYEFFEGDESVGYCVYTKKGTTAQILDLVTMRRPRNCLRLLVEHTRREGIARLSFRGIHLGMGRFGFARGAAPGKCIVYKAPEGHWMITMCDSDW